MTRPATSRATRTANGAPLRRIQSGLTAESVLAAVNERINAFEADGREAAKPFAKDASHALLQRLVDEVEGARLSGVSPFGPARRSGDLFEVQLDPRQIDGCSDVVKMVLRSNPEWVTEQLKANLEALELPVKRVNASSRKLAVTFIKPDSSAAASAQVGAEALEGTQVAAARTAALGAKALTADSITGPALAARLENNLQWNAHEQQSVVEKCATGAVDTVMERLLQDCADAESTGTTPFRKQRSPATGKEWRRAFSVELDAAALEKYSPLVRPMLLEPAGSRQEFTQAIQSQLEARQFKGEVVATPVGVSILVGQPPKSLAAPDADHQAIDASLVATVLAQSLEAHRLAESAVAIPFAEGFSDAALTNLVNAAQRVKPPKKSPFKLVTIQVPSATVRDPWGRTTTRFRPQNFMDAFLCEYRPSSVPGYSKDVKALLATAKGRKLAAGIIKDALAQRGMPVAYVNVQPDKATVVLTKPRALRES